MLAIKFYLFFISSGYLTCNIFVHYVFMFFFYLVTTVCEIKMCLPFRHSHSGINILFKVFFYLIIVIWKYTFYWKLIICLGGHNVAKGTIFGWKNYTKMGLIALRDKKMSPTHIYMLKTLYWSIFDLKTHNIYVLVC